MRAAGPSSALKQFKLLFTMQQVIKQLSIFRECFFIFSFWHVKKELFVILINDITLFDNTSVRQQQAAAVLIIHRRFGSNVNCKVYY